MIPEGLASALENFQSPHALLRRINKATAHFYISSPLKAGKATKLARWQIVYDTSARGGKDKGLYKFRNKIIFEIILFIIN